MSLADDLIRSGEYRIKIIHRLEPLWTMYIPQLRGLFGWKTIWYNPDISLKVRYGYMRYCYLASIESAKQAIINHYNQTHPTIEIYEPTPED